MNMVNFAASLLGAGFGLYAAILWLKASRVPVVTPWADNSLLEPVESDRKQAEWTAAILDAFQQASDLNRRASVWTALAVLFGLLPTAANVMSAF